MAATLNPRLDVVFKLLFADERNGELLVSLLNAVLRPARPIASVQVVNPEIQKDAPDDRGLVLDILAVHDDGTRTDVEMQCDDRGATGQRALFHWARVYRDGLNRGDAFMELCPVRVVFILGYEHLPGTRMHSIFQVREVHDGTRLSDDLEIHLVELPKAASEAEVEATERAAHEWAMFLAAETDEERRRLAMGNEDIRKATEALDRLSQDPKAQSLARWREDQMRMYRVELAAMERRGLERGLEQGLERERTLIRRLLDKKFGPLCAATLAQLDVADHAALERYADRVLTARSLEEVLDA
jgi:predicted transposase/invertase (TIGR01784 family)